MNTPISKRKSITIEEKMKIIEASTTTSQHELAKRFFEQNPIFEKNSFDFLIFHMGQVHGVSRITVNLASYHLIDVEKNFFRAVKTKNKLAIMLIQQLMETFLAFSTIHVPRIWRRFASSARIEVQLDRILDS